MPPPTTTPTTPVASGPKSVRAIVNWLETSGAGANGAKGPKPAASSTRAKDSSTVLSPPPSSPSPKPWPPPRPVATLPRISSNSSTRSSTGSSKNGPALPAPSPASPPLTPGRLWGSRGQTTGDAMACVDKKDSAVLVHGNITQLQTKTETTGEKKKVRSKQEIDVFWSNLRQSLAIKDEEIYGP